MLIQPHRQPLIGTLLSSAGKLWLRSQVESIDHLHLTIEGSNRSLLTGHIPQVSVTATQAVYQGLHLSQVQLQGSGIRFNLGQVLKGQPLQLLEPFFITGNLQFTQFDLKASLQASILAEGLKEFLFSLLGSVPMNPLLSRPEPLNILFPDIQQLQDPDLTLAQNQVTLTTKILLSDGQLIPFVLKTFLKLASPHELTLVKPLLESSELIPTTQLEDYTINLGSDINIEELIICEDSIDIKASIKVNP